MDRKIPVLFLCFLIIKLKAAIDEPKCFSSFDFQEKLLEKMVVLTQKVDTLEHLIDKKLEELSEKANQLRDERLAMKSELANISIDLNNKIETKMATFERQHKSNLEETNKKVDGFFTKTNLKLQRISLDVSAAMNTTLRGNNCMFTGHTFFFFSHRGCALVQLKKIKFM